MNAIGRPKDPKMYIPAQGRIRIKLPFLRENPRDWISEVCGTSGHSHVRWNEEEQRWEVSRAHFDKLFRAIKRRWGIVHIYEEHLANQECCPQCMQAKRELCECGCLGRNHGIDCDEPPRSDWELIATTDKDTEMKIAHWLIPAPGP